MTDTVNVTSEATAPSTGRAGFGGVLLSEWTKLRSVRSTFWSLVFFVVLFLGLTTLLVWLTESEWDNTDADVLETIVADPTAVILGSGFLAAQLATCVLGVLAISAEYSTGMIKSSVLAVPTRYPLLAAKAIVLGAVVLVVGLAASFASFFIGVALLGDRVEVSLGDPGVLRAVIGTALYVAVVSLFSLAVGAIVRHTAGGITAVLVFVFLVAPVVQLLPGRLGEQAHAYMPTESGALISQTQQAQGDLLSPWEGFGVLCLWTVVLLAIATAILRRRDT